MEKICPMIILSSLSAAKTSVLEFLKIECEKTECQFESGEGAIILKAKCYQINFEFTHISSSQQQRHINEFQC